MSATRLPAVQASMNQNQNQAQSPDPHQQSVVMVTAAPPQPPPPPDGFMIPKWVIQFVPILTAIAGAIMLFAMQRADVDQLKTSVAEIKAVQANQNQIFVSQQVFDLKMNEYDKSFVNINSRLDKIEGLINGLYDRLPSKNGK